MVRVKDLQLRPEIILEDLRLRQAKEQIVEDAVHAAEWEKLVLKLNSEELLAGGQMAELLDTFKD